MGYLSVILATIGAYAFGAFWYIYMSKPWIKAAGIPVDASGNGSPLPFIVGFLCVLVVAGMMRHIFDMAALDTVGECLMGGFGLGAFDHALGGDELHLRRPPPRSGAD